MQGVRACKKLGKGRQGLACRPHTTPASKPATSASTLTRLKMKLLKAVISSSEEMDGKQCKGVLWTPPPSLPIANPIATNRIFSDRKLFMNFEKLTEKMKFGFLIHFTYLHHFKLQYELENNDGGVFAYSYTFWNSHFLFL